jgi:hypothetical protein
MGLKHSLVKKPPTPCVEVMDYNIDENRQNQSELLSLVHQTLVGYNLKKSNFDFLEK